MLFHIHYEKMKKEKLDEYGYPIHPEMNFAKPEGDFETRIALVIAFSLIIIGIILGLQWKTKKHDMKAMKAP